MVLSGILRTTQSCSAQGNIHYGYYVTGPRRASIALIHTLFIDCSNSYSARPTLIRKEALASCCLLHYTTPYYFSDTLHFIFFSRKATDLATRSFIVQAMGNLIDLIEIGSMNNDLLNL